MEHYKNLDLQDIIYFCEVDLIEKTEQWKDIVDFEGYYKASDLGRIKSLNRIVKHPNGVSDFPIKGIIRKFNIRNNYFGCTLTKEGVRKYCSVHRLVALTFIPNPLNLPEVNHIGLYPDGREGNKLDNRAISLEWSTSSDNAKHAFRNGLAIAKKGEECSWAKLTEKEVLEIKEKYKSGNITHKQLGVMYNISDGYAGEIIRGEKWKHVD